jgi:ketosteroid isomerase-like protein
MGANADAVRALHSGEAGRLRHDALYDLLADDVEWHALGPFAWSGSHRGHDAVRRWFEVLNASMDYERFELRELYEDGDTVVEIVEASGTAVSTGRPFASEVARVWTFGDDGKATRVRSYYDTYAYADALWQIAPPAQPS